MRSYLNLVEAILRNGEVESQRALVAGEQVTTKVLYNQQLQFDLDQHGRFPLVTTKKTSFKIVKEELKWFLRGSDNVNSLREKGVRIWDEWADENGNLGGSYPSTWRDFGGSCERKGCDQIHLLESLMKLHAVTGPDDKTIRQYKRRMILTSWDPNIKDNRGPVGCHTLSQYMITQGGKLHCTLHARSIDVFLGLPYNIASYALLTMLLAKIGNLRPGILCVNIANAHLYSNHLSGCEELITRQPFAPPWIDLAVTSLNDWSAELLTYDSHPRIVGDIAV